MLTDTEELPESGPASEMLPKIQIRDTFHNPQNTEPFQPDIPTQALMVALPGTQPRHFHVPRHRHQPPRLQLVP